MLVLTSSLLRLAKTNAPGTLQRSLSPLAEHLILLMFKKFVRSYDKKLQASGSLFETQCSCGEWYTTAVGRLTFVYELTSMSAQFS